MAGEPVTFGRGMKIRSSNRFSVGSRREELYARNPVIRRGKGPFVYDHDGNRFTDFDLMNGSLLLGHAPASITSTIKRWIGRGYAQGYASASHGMTSRLILEKLLVAEGYRAAGGEIFLYTDSVPMAVETLLNLSAAGEDRGTPLFVQGNREDTPPLYRVLPSLARQNNDLAAFKGARFVVVRCGERTNPAWIAEVAEYGSRYGVPLLADISSLDSFFHMCSLESWDDKFDALLMGNWIAAGLSIGVLMMRQSFLRALGGPDSLYERNALLIGEGQPSTYKLRAVQKCVTEVHGHGGLKALSDVYARFYDRLDMRLYEKTNGLIYLKNRGKEQGGYDRLRLQFLREGILLPRSETMNLSVSFAHSGEILARCAHRLNAHPAPGR